MSANDLCRLLEELCLTAWPALKTIHDDGWLLRFSQGHSGRSNSVTCLSAGVLPVAEKVDRAEAAYIREGLPPRFRITPLAPAGLVAELDRRGYLRQEENLVQSAAIPSGLAPTADGLDWRLETAPAVDLLASYAAALPLPAREADPMRRLLDAIAVPTLYLSAWDGDRYAGSALGVADRGWLGVYKVLVAPEQRGRGLSRRLMTRLLAAGEAAGAARAYLQVGGANQPALATYARLGFQTVYRYQYRQLI
ncbi:GNAT family N-acetyltransferase [Nitrospirillum viridazoti]|uniref:GNAT family N-acetyltransferase n=1 Tax=Nitrospirillum viridazoti CBAmc TaxID=1441467 RepID=A0A248JRP3_9PROT|nr:GNAT family N-acetyltransferase [Nitrospirillum amazonense]ASG21279.1 GNAT family N-acetyltransferase [Nitrospirillum amazonense CBAmc]TWB32941.1 acetyltransferase (GNAT) family protein [Nitrospirillum amazonense]